MMLPEKQSRRILFRRLILLSVANHEIVIENQNQTFFASFA